MESGFVQCDEVSGVAAVRALWSMLWAYFQEPFMYLLAMKVSELFTHISMQVISSFNGAETYHSWLEGAKHCLP